MTVSTPAIRALILLLAANAAPWMLGRLLHERLAWPLDFGATFVDGRRLLGEHKTWRGLAAGALACGLVAWLFGLGVALGLSFGVLALAGDAISSFLKRRLGRAAGEDAPVMDQLPEALLPLTALAVPLELGVREIVLVAAVFVVLDLLALRLRHRDRKRSRRP